ncbi:MAG TPA: hypothetical protein VK841_09420 [Polyangiaceae bacterium]|jgi:hypothetical protein|nr:hypothetical protein [Polyangiaceae bacterium]
MKNLIQMKYAPEDPRAKYLGTHEVSYLDPTTGREYKDEGGMHLLREMEPTEYLLGPGAIPIRDENGNMVHTSHLANVAADHYHRKVVALTGRDCRYTMRERDGRLVKMDLGVADVHTPSTMPNYAAGYRIADGVADVASPVVQVSKQSDVYYTWNSSNDFNRKIPNVTAPGAPVSEVNPGLSPTTYSTVQYGLGGFLPTEIMSNADAPLRPMEKLMQVVVDALRLEREYRVATLLQTSASWNSGLVTTIAAGSQWNGGASSDPIANLQAADDASYMPLTGIVFSKKMLHAFQKNPAVQKYIYAKAGIKPIPAEGDISTDFTLPTIYVAQMKYIVGGALTYVWGNHVVLLRQPAETPPTSQMDVASSYTFRWIGGTAPDGSQQAGGLLVRSFFDPKRGPRGGTTVVATVNDTELQTSGLVGGLLLNCLQ